MPPIYCSPGRAPTGRTDTMRLSKPKSLRSDWLQRGAGTEAPSSVPRRPPTSRHKSGGAHHANTVPICVPSVLPPWCMATYNNRPPTGRSRLQNSLPSDCFTNSRPDLLLRATMSSPLSFSRKRSRPALTTAVSGGLPRRTDPENLAGLGVEGEELAARALGKAETSDHRQHRLLRKIETSLFPTPPRWSMCRSRLIGLNAASPSLRPLTMIVSS